MERIDLLDRYELKEDELLFFYDHIVSFLKDKGVIVSYINLERVVETDIYKINRQIKEEDKHHESCISDGAEVFLHFDMEDVGGITGRLYDILHVGCGHLWQWNASEESDLMFYGDKAWEIGSTFYLDRPEEEIQLAYDYEKEAGVIAIANLRFILSSNNYNIDFSEKIVSLFTDYMNTDLEYITSYYRTGVIRNFFDKWQYKSTISEDIKINFPINVSRKTNKCIALIGVR